MRNHDHPVFSDGHVEFQHVHALSNGVLECWKSIFGTKAARAAMSVNFYSAGRFTSHDRRHQ